MIRKYNLTYEGEKLREKLADEAQYSTHPTDRQLEDMRRLWVLDQYLKSKTDPMTGPIMGRIFNKLVKEGFIWEV